MRNICSIKDCKDLVRNYGMCYQHWANSDLCREKHRQYYHAKFKKDPKLVRKRRKQRKFYNRTSHGRFKTLQNGALHRGLSCEITETEFITLTQKVCTYCGQLNPESNYVGIDRINSEEGYTIKNSVPCCRVCNIMKSDLSINEFKDYIAKIFNKFQEQI